MKAKNPSWLTPVIGLLLFGITLFDTYTGVGRAEYIFLFLPVALTIFSHRPVFAIQTAFVASICNILGFVLSPPTEVSQTLAFLNRTYSIISIWAVAYAVYQALKLRQTVTREGWAREGLRRVSEAVRGELSVEQVASRGVEVLAQYLGADIGLVYGIRNGKPVLEPMAGYRHELPTGDGAMIAVGTGPLGQVASSKKIAIANQIPQGSLRFQTSTTVAAPRKIVVAPLLAEDETRGVIELGFLDENIEIRTDLLELIAEPFGTALRSAQFKARLAELLLRAEKQAEELQVQQEELKVVNEELEQQMNLLKESQAKLENQQAELEQSNQHLEEQAQQLELQKRELDERNSTLLGAQEQLRMKALELQRSSRYKSEFLANMSHELRTPLNSSLILARLLADNKDGNLSKEQVQFAETIYSAGNDLLTLINDVLDLSKVEAGKLDIHREEIEPTRMLDTMERFFKPIGEQKGVKFRLDIEKGLPEKIETDRHRVEQILKNLLSNAFKFTSQGEVVLKVAKSERGVSYTVQDSGIGIAPDQLEVIFEAFRQADGTTNRKFGGTGLGLSISRELAKLLGGEILVESEVGQGSAFTLDLPLVMSQARTQATQQQTESPAPQAGQEKKTAQSKPTRMLPSQPKPEAGSSAPLKFAFKDDRESFDKSRGLLIIEDDETFAKSLYDLSKEMDFKTIVAPTASEGLEMVNTYEPKAVVLDVRLPDHSGLALLDTLKGNPKTRHIPVHMISSEDFAKTAYQMGAVGYMMKPVQRDMLEKAFRKLESRINQKVKRLLIVEDDATQRNALEALISDPGIEIEAVASAAEALDRLSQEVFDCMILDLSLPDLGGYELLEKLADFDSPYSYPPVIVYTGRDLSQREEEKLRRYSETIIIKGARSPERLLNEVTLFLHRVESDLPPDRQKILRDLRNRDQTLEGRKILVVDDDVRNIFAMTGLLEPKGAKIEIARNGIEALQKLDGQTDIDLVLMDIMMPEMDGYEAMQKIRAQSRFTKLPIIAITAKAMRDDQEQCLRAGANDYLAKPIEIEKLMSLIKIWMPPRRSH